ncbi:MAG: TraR/DksA C4-type zinc finger protein [Planctomycetes bacterium]|nr:TraR/DksA C4-type zinc finger protein [Planctomycetota bacterium]
MRQARCESCGREFPVPRMRRLVWARVCLACARTLAARPLKDPRPALRAPGGAPLLRALSILFFYGGIAVLARAGSEGVRSLVAGVLCAELLTWGLFGLVRAPFEGLRFGVDLAVRLAALLIVQGPGLADVQDSLRLGLGAAGFFSFLFVRALWFGLWWSDLIEEEGDAADLGGLLPFLRDRT